MAAAAEKAAEAEKAAAEAKDIEEPWSFYIIQNKGCTYAGVSPDPVKRLRKHNGEISGGAKYTQSKGPGWTHVCLVHGFQTKNQALQFEWAVKHVPPRDSGGLFNRIKKLFVILNKPKWTSKAPDSATVPLTLEWKIVCPLGLAGEKVPPYVSINSISLQQSN
jgi:predicted GIY-YIG superfamily endonuclease